MRKMDVIIENYIPYGKDNAVTREELVMRTGLSDRQVRDCIEEAKRERGACICNLSDSKGYFFPTIEEYQQLKSYIDQEESRAKKILTALRGHKALYEDIIKGRMADGLN